MKLTNFIKVLEPYQGKSKFSFWTNLKPDDRVEISMILSPPGSGRSLYATTIYFRAFNPEDPSINGTFQCSLTEASNYLNKLKNIEEL